MRGLILATIFLAACGDVLPASLDGATRDGDGDASLPDAPAFGPVDVVFRYGEVIPGATILVYDVDGRLLFEDVTDATGHKRLENVPRGGSIYAGKVYGGAPRAASVYGVKPGDNLVLGEFFGDTTSTSLNIASSSAGAVHHHDVGAGCDAIATNQTAFPIILGAPNACRTGSSWTLVAFAYSSATTVSQFAVVQNATAATPVALTGFSDASNLSGFLLGVSNPLPGATAADLELIFGWPVVGQKIQTIAGSGTASWSFPAGVQPRISYRVTSRINLEAASIFERTIDPIRMETVNMGLLMLPYVGMVSGDWTNTARPILSWSADPALVAASKMILIRNFWDGPGFYEWSVALPADGSQTRYQFPAIPTAHVELIPPAGAGWTFSATVNYVEGGSATFDQMRQEPSKPYPGRSAWRAFQLGPPL